MARVFRRREIRAGEDVLREAGGDRLELAGTGAVRAQVQGGHGYGAGGQAAGRGGVDRARTRPRRRRRLRKPRARRGELPDHALRRGGRRRAQRGHHRGQDEGAALRAHQHVAADASGAVQVTRGTRDFFWFFWFRFWFLNLRSSLFLSFLYSSTLSVNIRCCS